MSKPIITYDEYFYTIDVAKKQKDLIQAYVDTEEDLTCNMIRADGYPDRYFIAINVPSSTNIDKIINIINKLNLSWCPDFMEFEPPPGSGISDEYSWFCDFLSGERIYVDIYGTKLTPEIIQEYLREKQKQGYALAY